MTMPEKPSVFLTLAAQAFSTVGFSVSILAWLWLSILPPAPTEPIIIDKKARRRSAPAALQSHPRLYFIDSPLNAPSRPSSRPNDSSEILDKPLHSSPTTEVSPASSSSTLVHTYPAIPPRLETCRESVESDSSNSSSPRRSLSLTRPFQRTRRASGTDVPLPPASDTKQPRRSSGNLVSPWTFRRTSTSSKSVTASTPNSGTTVAPTQSYFSRKATRRVSTPVARTQPYAYPYFAEPPTIDDRPVQALARSGTVSESEGKDDASILGTKSRNGKLNDKAQAALGLGRRPSTPQRNPQRSVSEGWVDRPSP
ncbi:hypothetical protein C8F01DRAFT_1107689 [Mycena amicta]|nr:hypothetical protein C8F01DRAFT_1107689 [Mycena amicta]